MRKHHREVVKKQAVLALVAEIAEGRKNYTTVVATRYGISNYTLTRWRREECSLCGRRRTKCVCTICASCGNLEAPKNG